MKMISVRELDTSRFKERLIVVDKICSIGVDDECIESWIFLEDGSTIKTRMTKKQILDKIEFTRKENLKNIFST